MTFKLPELNLHYLNKQRRENDSLRIMKVYVFLNEGDVVLVQFTGSFAVLLSKMTSSSS